jgi:hypothetical protein
MSVSQAPKSGESRPTARKIANAIIIDSGLSTMGPKRANELEDKESQFN